MKPTILKREDIFRDGEAIMANEVLHDEIRDMHAHEFYEIACVLSGSGQHYVGTQVQKLETGDVVLINPYIPHAYIPSKQDPLHLCNVTFTEGALEAHLDHREATQALTLFLRVDGAKLLDLAGEKPPDFGLKISPIMREMAAEYWAREPGYQLVLRGLLLTLLLRLWRESEQSHPEGPSQEDDIWQTLFPCFRLIYRNAGAHLTVTQLADTVGWSVDHFSRIFKQATGETVQRYMRLIRVRRAASLLLTTSKPIDEIAAHVGYADPKGLRRAFESCFGVTPHTYRRIQSDKSFTESGNPPESIHTSA